MLLRHTPRPVAPMPPRTPFAVVAVAVEERFPAHSWRAFCRFASSRGLDVHPHTVTRARQGTAAWQLDWSEALADHLLLEHPGAERQVAEAVWGPALDRLGVKVIADDVVAGTVEEELHAAALSALDLASRHARALSPVSPSGASLDPVERQDIVQAARQLRDQLDALIAAHEADAPTPLRKTS